MGPLFFDPGLPVLTLRPFDPDFIFPVDFFVFFVVVFFIVVFFVVDAGCESREDFFLACDFLLEKFLLDDSFECEAFFDPEVLDFDFFFPVLLPELLPSADVGLESSLLNDFRWPFGLNVRFLAGRLRFVDFLLLRFDDSPWRAESLGSRLPCDFASAF